MDFSLSFSSSFTKPSAGGQDEQPSEVKSSTSAKLLLPVLPFCAVASPILYPNIHNTHVIAHNLFFIFLSMQGYCRSISFVTIPLLFSTFKRYCPACRSIK